MADNLPATVRPEPRPIARDVVKAIAMDIGKELAAYIEVQYPAAVAAASSTFLLSVRNCTYNQIMAALDTTDEEAIRARLARRKKHRRELRATWKRIREQGGVAGDAA
jgi:hypothetical protein